MSPKASDWEFVVSGLALGREHDCCRDGMLEGGKRDKRDRRDSENCGVGSGRYILIIYIIYILYNNKE